MNDQFEIIKQTFAKEFIEAFSTKSVEKCSKLILSYDDQIFLAGEDTDINISRTEYDKNIITPTEMFLEKASHFIDKNNTNTNSQLVFSNIKAVDLHNFEINKELIQGIDTISISMNTRLLDGINYEVGFQIDDALLVNGKIKITNWFFVKYYESYWEDINKENTPYPEIESKERLNDLFKNIDTEYKDYIHNWNKWYIHEGDLELDNYEVKVNLIVTGNLTIKAPLVEIIHPLVVLGKTFLNALYLEEDNDVVFIGGINFNLAVFIDSSGAFQAFNKAEGVFFYTNSESYEIDDFDNISYVLDIPMGEYKGDLQYLLLGKFIEERDDEDTYGLDGLDIHPLIEAIRNGEHIFRKKTPTNE